MTALDHYRDQIQQALKQAPMSQLPEPLATIAYLLACGNDANAAGLAEYLMELEKRIADLLKSNHEEVEEFNAGYDAFTRGEPIENEHLYSSKHDAWATGWVWAKHIAALREEAG